jgi:hypothetical protein
MFPEEERRTRPANLKYVRPDLLTVIGGNFLVEILFTFSFWYP